MHSVNNMNVYAAELNILPEQIQGYIVHREPGTAPDTQTAAQEPMETDGTLPAPVAGNDDSARSRVILETETLPEVLMGAEPWHGTVPSVSYAIFFNSRLSRKISGMGSCNCA